MPVGFAPSKDAAHRLACLALYRALLKQCGMLIPQVTSHSAIVHKSSSSTLQALVQRRFKKDRKLRSWQQIRDALHFGRTSLSLLRDAADGSVRALCEIERTVTAGTMFVTRQKEALQEIKREHAQQTLPRKFAERKRRELSLADKSNYVPRPNTVPVLQRPVPYEQALKHKDGRRKVPVYFVGQGVPFLRYTSRQPLSMGWQFARQIKRAEKLGLVDASNREMAPIAKSEDDWDRHMWRDHGISQPDLVNTYGNGAKMWTDTINTVSNDVRTKIRKMDQSRFEHGEKLFKIYLAEEQLAQSENLARKKERHKSGVQ